MAINSCSISAFTINSLHCRRRQFIPQPPVTPAEKSHVQQVRYQNWFGGTEREEETFIGQLESSHINVAITLNGVTYEQTQENSIHDVIPMIVVSQVKVEAIENQEVSVINLQLKRDK